MCINKFYTQQHSRIYDMTNNLKITISMGGTLLIVKCLYLPIKYIYTLKLCMGYYRLPQIAAQVPHVALHTFLCGTWKVFRNKENNKKYVPFWHFRPHLQIHCGTWANIIENPWVISKNRSCLLKSKSLKAFFFLLLLSQKDKGTKLL